jgi:hypothetical protein
VDLPPLRPGPSGRAEASVRPAVPSDAEEIARVQVVTWRTAYRALLPAAVLDDWDDDAAAAAWHAAVRTPPTSGHGVLVAEEAGTVVGFAAYGPAGLSEDESPAAAVADVARAQGVGRLQMWLPEADRVSAGFLESAGWARDGWARALDAGTATIREVRWHTLLVDGPADRHDERGAT